jgi:hypothetical protein
MVAVLMRRRLGSVGGRDSRPAPAVRLGPELAFQLHQAQHPGAVGATVRLDVGGQLADGGQVDAEQLRALLQRCRDRPAEIRVVLSPRRVGYRTVRGAVGNATDRNRTDRWAHWGHKAPACTELQRIIRVRD